MLKVFVALSEYRNFGWVLLVGSQFTKHNLCEHEKINEKQRESSENFKSDFSKC